MNTKDITDWIWSLFWSFIKEFLKHGTIRSGFLLAMIVAFIPSAAYVLWIGPFHPDMQSSFNEAALFLLGGIAVVGSIILVETDMRDQESGAYSKWGSAWELWGDNYLSNSIAKPLLYLVAIICFMFSGYHAYEGVSGIASAKDLPAKVTSTKIASAKVSSKAQAKHPVHGKHNPHHKKPHAHQAVLRNSHITNEPKSNATNQRADGTAIK